ARSAVNRGPLGVGLLDGPFVRDPGVLREVDGPDPAAPERRDDLVFPELLTLEEQRAEYTRWRHPRLAAPHTRHVDRRRGGRGGRAELFWDLAIGGPGVDFATDAVFHVSDVEV